MVYRWRYENNAGQEVAGRARHFVEQDEAEAWLSESWPDLLASGIDQVVLLDDDGEVYGPMSLHPPE